MVVHRLIFDHWAMIGDLCDFNENADHEVGQFWTAGSPNKVRAGPDGVADDWFGKGSPCLDTTITILITTKTTSSQPPLPSSPSSPKTPGGSLEQPGQTQPSKVASEDNKPFLVTWMSFLIYDENAVHIMHLLPENWGSTLSIDRRAKKNLWFVNLGICATLFQRQVAFFKDSLISTIIDCPKVAPQIWSEYEYFRWMEQE